MSQMRSWQMDANIQVHFSDLVFKMATRTNKWIQHRDDVTCTLHVLLQKLGYHTNRLWSLLLHTSNITVDVLQRLILHIHLCSTSVIISNTSMMMLSNRERWFEKIIVDWKDGERGNFNLWWNKRTVTGDRSCLLVLHGVDTTMTRLSCPITFLFYNNSRADL
jgi:hypothetical protein